MRGDAVPPRAPHGCRPARGRVRSGGPHRLDACARARRRRSAPLLPEARARHRSCVPGRDDHRLARRRRLRTARDTRAARRSARVGGRRRPAPPRGRGQAAAPARLVTDSSTSTSRPFRSTDRGTEPALFMEDSAWPYEAKLDDYLEAAAHALRTESRAADRAVVADTGRRVPGRARRAAASRGRVVAAGRPSRAAPGTVHDGAARRASRDPARGCTTRSKCATTGRAASCEQQTGRPSTEPTPSRPSPFGPEATFSPRRSCRPCRRARGTRPRTRPSCIRSRARPTRAPSRCRSARASSRPAACTAPGSSLHRR